MADTSELLEKIARCIEPDAWQEVTNGDDYPAWASRRAALRHETLAKADAILALLAPGNV